MKLVFTYKELMEIRIVKSGMDFDATLVNADTYTPEHYLFNANVYKGGPGSGNFDHAGRPGLVGGSLSDKIHASMKPLFKQRAMAILARNDLSNIEHLVGTITTAKPITEKYKDDGLSWKNTKIGHAVTGVCIWNGSKYDIHIHPSVASDEDFLERTLLHELGHVITHKNIDTNPGNSNLVREYFKTVKKYINSQADTRQALRYLGLRNYSMSEPDEFISDVFATVKSADKDTVTRLMYIMGDDGMTDPLPDILDMFEK